LSETIHYTIQDLESSFQKHKKEKERTNQEKNRILSIINSPIGNGEKENDNSVTKGEERIKFKLNGEVSDIKEGLSEIFSGIISTGFNMEKYEIQHRRPCVPLEQGGFECRLLGMLWSLLSTPLGIIVIIIILMMVLS